MGRTRGRGTRHGGLYRRRWTAGTVERAFGPLPSGLMVDGSCPIERVIRRDTQGDRQPGFVFAPASGLSVPVYHDVDLASRVDTFESGDILALLGPYEYQEPTGVLH